jgi:hypothetical protein
MPDTPELVHYRLVRGLVDDLVQRDPTCLGMAVETLGDLEVACRTFGWRMVVSFSCGKCKVHVTTDLGIEIVEDSQSFFGCLLNPHFAGAAADSYDFAVTHLHKEGRL